MSAPGVTVRPCRLVHQLQQQQRQVVKTRCGTAALPATLMSAPVVTVRLCGMQASSLAAAAAGTEDQACHW
jgi:hypothetical protein